MNGGLPVQRGANLPQQQTNTILDETGRTVAGLGQTVIIAPNPVVESQKADNALWLGAGAYGGLSLAAQRTRLAGGSGASIGGVAGFAGTAVATGLDFTNAVNLSASSRSIFIGCTFRQTSSVAQLIAAVAGAKATFIGCAFYGNVTMQVVDNPGVITDIVLLGCHNATGAAAGNVTEIGGV